MKLTFVSMLLVTVLLFSSCTKNPNNNEIPQMDDTVYGESDLAGMNVTYVKTTSGFIPFAIVKDGHSMLSDENYYYDLVNMANNDTSLTTKPITAFDSNGINLGVVVLDKDTSSPYDLLFTSGNWKLCPALRHTTSQDEGFKQFIMESFPDKFKSVADITVTDITECDIDGDGINEAFVLANTDNYCILALLSQSIGNKILASDFDNPDYNAYAYAADIDGNGLFSIVTVAGDNFQKLTVLKENSLDTDYCVYLPLLG